MRSSLPSGMAARTERISAISVEGSGGGQSGWLISAAISEMAQPSKVISAASTSGRDATSGISEQQPQDLGVGDEASGLAGQQRAAAAHLDAPPSWNVETAGVVELPLGIKAGSLVLTGAGMWQRVRPTNGTGSGWVQTRPGGGPRWFELQPPAGTGPASSWSLLGPRTSGQQRAVPGAMG